MYIRSRARRFRGLGQTVAPIVGGVMVPYGTPPDATSCSYWDFFFNNAAWQACATAAEVAQINTVPANAAQYYGPDSVTAVTARAAAAEESSYAPSDVSGISNYYYQPGSVFPFSVPGSVFPFSVPWWVWVIGGGGVLLLVVKR